MALYLIGLGWLLAAASAVLWLRQHPGQRLGRRYLATRQGRPLTVLGLAGIAPAAYGGSGLQTRYHWGWWVVPAVYVPLFFLGTAAPILFRRWQLRRTAEPADIDNSAVTPLTG